MIFLPAFHSQNLFTLTLGAQNSDCFLYMHGHSSKYWAGLWLLYFKIHETSYYFPEVGLRYLKIFAVPKVVTHLSSEQAHCSLILFDPGWVIPKAQKMVLDAALLYPQHYKVQIKGKVEKSREGVVPSPTHWYGSCWKGSLQVTLD